MQTTRFGVIRASCFLLLLALLAVCAGAGWRPVQASADGSYQEANYDPAAKPDLRLAGWKIHRCCFGSRATRPAHPHGRRKHTRPYDRHARLARTHFRYRKPRHSSGFRLHHPRSAASPKHARS